MLPNNKNTKGEEMWKSMLLINLTGRENIGVCKLKQRRKRERERERERTKCKNGLSMKNTCILVLANGFEKKNRF